MSTSTPSFRSVPAHIGHVRSIERLLQAIGGNTTILRAQRVMMGAKLTPRSLQAIQQRALVRQLKLKALHGELDAQDVLQAKEKMKNLQDAFKTQDEREREERDRISSDTVKQKLEDTLKRTRADIVTALNRGQDLSIEEIQKLIKKLSAVTSIIEKKENFFERRRPLSNAASWVAVIDAKIADLKRDVEHFVPISEEDTKEFYSRIHDEIQLLENQRKQQVILQLQQLDMSDSNGAKRVLAENLRHLLVTPLANGATTDADTLTKSLQGMSKIISQTKEALYGLSRLPELTPFERDPLENMIKETGNIIHLKAATAQTPEDRKALDDLLQQYRHLSKLQSTEKMTPEQLSVEALQTQLRQRAMSGPQNGETQVQFLQALDDLEQSIVSRTRAKGDLRQQTIDQLAVAISRRAATVKTVQDMKEMQEMEQKRQEILLGLYSTSDDEHVLAKYVKQRARLGTINAMLEALRTPKPDGQPEKEYLEGLSQRQGQVFQLLSQEYGNGIFRVIGRYLDEFRQETRRLDALRTQYLNDPEKGRTSDEYKEADKNFRNMQQHVITLENMIMTGVTPYTDVDDATKKLKDILDNEASAGFFTDLDRLRISIQETEQRTPRDAQHYYQEVLTIEAMKETVTKNAQMSNEARAGSIHKLNQIRDRWGMHLFGTQRQADQYFALQKKIHDPTTDKKLIPFYERDCVRLSTERGLQGEGTAEAAERLLKLVNDDGATIEQYFQYLDETHGTTMLGLHESDVNKIVEVKRELRFCIESMQQIEKTQIFDEYEIQITPDPTQLPKQAADDGDLGAESTKSETRTIPKKEKPDFRIREQFRGFLVAMLEETMKDLKPVLEHFKYVHEYLEKLNDVLSTLTILLSSRTQPAGFADAVMSVRTSIQDIARHAILKIGNHRDFLQKPAKELENTIRRLKELQREDTRFLMINEAVQHYRCPKELEYQFRQTLFELISHELAEDARDARPQFVENLPVGQVIFGAWIRAIISGYNEIVKQLETLEKDINSEEGYTNDTQLTQELRDYRVKTENAYTELIRKHDGNASARVFTQEISDYIRRKRQGQYDRKNRKLKAELLKKTLEELGENEEIKEWNASWKQKLEGIATKSMHHVENLDDAHNNEQLLRQCLSACNEYLDQFKAAMQAVEAQLKTDKASFPVLEDEIDKLLADCANLFKTTGPDAFQTALNAIVTSRNVLVNNYSEVKDLVFQVPTYEAWNGTDNIFGAIATPVITALNRAVQEERKTHEGALRLVGSNMKNAFSVLAQTGLNAQQGIVGLHDLIRQYEKNQNKSDDARALWDMETRRCTRYIEEKIKEAEQKHQEGKEDKSALIEFCLHGPWINPTEQSNLDTRITFLKKLHELADERDKLHAQLVAINDKQGQDFTSTLSETFSKTKGFLFSDKDVEREILTQYVETIERTLHDTRLNVQRSENQAQLLGFIQQVIRENNLESSNPIEAYEMSALQQLSVLFGEFGITSTPSTEGFIGQSIRDFYKEVNKLMRPLFPQEGDPEYYEMAEDGTIKNIQDGILTQFLEQKMTFNYSVLDDIEQSLPRARALCSLNNWQGPTAVHVQDTVNKLHRWYEVDKKYRELEQAMIMTVSRDRIEPLLDIRDEASNAISDRKLDEAEKLLHQLERALHDAQQESWNDIQTAQMLQQRYERARNTIDGILTQRWRQTIGNGMPQAAFNKMISGYHENSLNVWGDAQTNKERKEIVDKLEALVQGFNIQHEQFLQGNQVQMQQLTQIPELIPALEEFFPDLIPRDSSNGFDDDHDQGPPDLEALPDNDQDEDQDMHDAAPSEHMGGDGRGSPDGPPFQNDENMDTGDVEDLHDYSEGSANGSGQETGDTQTPSYSQVFNPGKRPTDLRRQSIDNFVNPNNRRQSNAERQKEARRTKAEQLRGVNDLDGPRSNLLQVSIEPSQAHQAVQQKLEQLQREWQAQRKQLQDQIEKQQQELQKLQKQQQEQQLEQQPENSRTPNIWNDPELRKQHPIPQKATLLTVESPLIVTTEPASGDKFVYADIPFNETTFGLLVGLVTRGPGHAHGKFEGVWNWDGQFIYERISAAYGEYFPSIQQHVNGTIRACLENIYQGGNDLNRDIDELVRRNILRSAFAQQDLADLVSMTATTAHIYIATAGDLLEQEETRQLLFYFLTRARAQLSERTLILLNASLLTLVLLHGANDFDQTFWPIVNNTINACAQLSSLRYYDAAMEVLGKNKGTHEEQKAYFQALEKMNPYNGELMRTWFRFVKFCHIMDQQLAGDADKTATFTRFVELLKMPVEQQDRDLIDYAQDRSRIQFSDSRLQQLFSSELPSAQSGDDVRFEDFVVQSDLTLQEVLEKPLPTTTQADEPAVMQTDDSAATTVETSNGSPGELRSAIQKIVGKANFYHNLRALQARQKRAPMPRIDVVVEGQPTFSPAMRAFETLATLKGLEAAKNVSRLHPTVAEEVSRKEIQLMASA